MQTHGSDNRAQWSGGKSACTGPEVGGFCETTRAILRPRYLPLLTRQICVSLDGPRKAARRGCYGSFMRVRRFAAVTSFAVLALGLWHCGSNGGPSHGDGSDQDAASGASGMTGATGAGGATGTGGGGATGATGTAGATGTSGTSGAATGTSASGTSGGGSGTAATGTSSTGSTDGGSDASAATGIAVATFVGANGLITDSVADLAPIGVVREYHNWGWLGNNYNDLPYPQTLYTPNIDDFGWDWDTFFSDLQSMGVSSFPAVQGTAPWVADGGVPPAEGSPTDAASYRAHGDTMFQIAARWGSTQVADSLLKLESDQTRVSGLGTVRYFEDYNEEDNAAGFTGDVFAAMASADYDGDQQRLGTTIGVKNADPNAMLVMGGLSGAYGGGQTWINSITTFLDAARTWSAAHRGGSFPADVINVHYYSFGPGAPAPALSPEDDGVQAKLAAVVAYRDANLPGKPVWWTEFGYDTYAGSPLHAPALGSNSAFIVQGQWLVRDLLAALAAGIERATLFELDDTCTPPDASCNTQFATAGLLPLPSGTTPKAAWYFLATFRARLQTMVYRGETASGAADVRVASFADTAAGGASGTGGALVVWSPTSTANVHAGYSLALPAGAGTATAVTLADQQANGVTNALSPQGGNVMLDVTETPTIVVYGP
jgi:hypothetical protein